MELVKEINRLKNKNLLVQVKEALSSKFDDNVRLIDLHVKELADFRVGVQPQTTYESAVLNIKGDLNNTKSILDEAGNIVFNKTNKLIDGGSEWLLSIKDFINQYYNFLDHLTLAQLASLTHLFAGLFLLICVFNVITIIYSDFIINYLKIEDRYPRFGKIVRLRRQFQHYYLILNLSLIILALLFIIYINYLALTI